MSRYVVYDNKTELPLASFETFEEAEAFQDGIESWPASWIEEHEDDAGRAAGGVE